MRTNPEQQHVANAIHHYKLDTGADVYRFSLAFYPPQGANIIDSGVGSGADFVWVTITDIAGTGCGAILQSEIHRFRRDPGCGVFAYLRSYGHGFGNVDAHTLCAVLLALDILIARPHALADAAEAMKEAGKILAKERIHE